MPPILPGLAACGAAKAAVMEPVAAIIERARVAVRRSDEIRMVFSVVFWEEPGWPPHGETNTLARAKR
jgi:hypothetical protein